MISLRVPFQRLQSTWSAYPRQFWLLFTGMLISTIGTSMVWPFLMIYVSEKLGLPMSQATTLNSINAAAGLVSVFLVGLFVDRIGRKGALVASLAITGGVYLLQSQANSYTAFALIMIISGAANPLYRVAADAMMADLLPKEKRVGGYSLMRMSNNLGISIGPAIGGFINSSSYGLAFFIAAGGMILYSLLVFFLAHETKPEDTPPAEEARDSGLGGYATVLRDRTFMSFVILFTLVQFCAALFWIVLPAYAKHNFGVIESQYGWLPTTNALMVVLLQVLVTTITHQYKALPVIAAGAFFYAIATAGVGIGQSFWAFWAAMVVMTIGELIMMPTASTFIANIAPADMRGRYMSLSSLSWSLASGIAPVTLSYVGEKLGPAMTWFGGGAVGLLSVFGFAALAAIQARRKRRSSG